MACLESLEHRVALSVDLTAGVSLAAWQAGGLFSPGQSVTVAATGLNWGDEDVVEQRMELRFAQGIDAWEASSTVVAWHTDFDVPKGGNNGVPTAQITIPANTPSGFYYVGVKIDAADQVEETDEGNNIAWSGAYFEVVGGSSSDVSFGFEFFTTPVTASGGSGPYRWGDTVSLSGGLWVDGTGAIGQSLWLRATIDLDAIFGNADDVASWTGSIVSSSLLPGSETPVQSGTMTIPDGTPDGAYSAYLLVNGDHAWNEVGSPGSVVPDNRGGAAGGIIVAHEDADLIAQITAISPSPGGVGQPIDIDFGVLNEYAWRASGASTAGFVLTRNGTIGDEDDIHLGELAVPALAGGASFGGTYTLTLPSSLDPGRWRVALVADANGEAAESDEDNNTVIFDDVIVSVPGPDLEFEDVLPDTPVTVEAGGQFGLGFVLRNSGDTQAGASWFEYFISADTVEGNSDDVTIGRFRVPALAPGEALEVQSSAFSVTIPAGQDPGGYYIGLRVDAEGEVVESDERNSGILDGQPFITVTESAAPGHVSLFGGTNLNVGLEHDRAAVTGVSKFAAVVFPFDTRSRSFRITNSGDGVLTIASVFARGGQSGDFIIDQPTDFTLDPGESTAFSITFDPQGYLRRRTKIVIATDDPFNSGEFFMRVRGRGVPADTLPDISVTGLTKPIVDGDRTAGRFTGQIVGTTPVGSAITRVFTISNVGGLDDYLRINEPRIWITGPHAAEFTLVGSLGTTLVGAGESTTFTVSGVPLGIGARKATIRIATNDPDEPVFDFKIKMTGI